MEMSVVGDDGPSSNILRSVCGVGLAEVPTVATDC